MAAESAIVLPVDEAEPVVGHLRWLHDPIARRGVPAHITLLYPFVRPPHVIDEAGTLGRLFSEVRPFEFALTEVRRFPATAYLHPDPQHLFVQLTEMIARHWPEFPPYGGTFPTLIPHLTVADRVDADVLDAVERTLANQLPIRCRATHAWLLCSNQSGFWSRSHTFPFGRPTSTAD